jgi:hypothetical protein
LILSLQISYLILVQLAVFSLFADLPLKVLYDAYLFDILALCFNQFSIDLKQLLLSCYAVSEFASDLLVDKFKKVCYVGLKLSIGR